jgi:AraC-like DNA-binding protein
MNDYQAELRVMRVAGVGRDALANPDLRIPESLAMQLLQVSLEKTRNPALGLHAGAHVEAAELGIMDAVARSAENLREGLQACIRYMCLLDEGTRAELVAEGQTVMWRLTPLGLDRPPAANDFAISAALNLGYQMLGARRAPLELHFTHSEPSYAAEYQRVFNCPVRWRQPQNSIVMASAALGLALSGTNRDLFLAFNTQADRMLSTRSGKGGLAGQVRQLLTNMLADGATAMTTIARHLNISVATLRRQLDADGTSYRRILDELRRKRALELLKGDELLVGHIALSLGFSTPQAFCRAFQRWMNESPAEYRTRLKAARPLGSR